MTASNIYTIA